MMDLTTLTSQDLADLAAAVAAEQGRRHGQMQQPMRVAVEFDGYNDRRYSRPWIARVTSWPVGGKPELTFGGYAGDERGGEAEIMAKPGDIVRYGQKDLRKSNGSMSKWAVVADNGNLTIISQAEARKLFAGE